MLQPSSLKRCPAFPDGGSRPACGRNRVSFGDQSVSLTLLSAVGEAASEFPDGEGADPVSGVSIGFAGSGVASIGVATGVLLKGIDLGASMS